MGSVRGLAGIDQVRLDDAIGPQRNSLRPNSARMAFARSRRFEEERSSQETPGPGVYDYASALKGVSAVIGTAGSVMHARGRPASGRRTPDQDQDEARVEEADAEIPDSGRYRFNAPPRATFGYEERGGKVMDSEYLRACPTHGYGENGPGFVYQPDDRRVRPRSAPSYTIPGRRDKGGMPQRSSTPAKVAPNSYPGAKEDAIGVQRTSKRRTASASSFGRADRFPAPKPASGGLSDECMAVRSDFGDPRTGKRASGSHACFGSATREGTARAGVSRGAGDRPISAKLGKQNLPHPPVAPRQELIRYGDNWDKHV